MLIWVCTVSTYFRDLPSVDYDNEELKSGFRHGTEKGHHRGESGISITLSGLWSHEVQSG